MYEGNKSIKGINLSWESMYAGKKCIKGMNVYRE